jgi:hypothetical protein
MGAGWNRRFYPDIFGVLAAHAAGAGNTPPFGEHADHLGWWASIA